VLLFAVVLFVATRAWILFVLDPYYPDTVPYAQSALHASLEGYEPYAEIPIEYPPVAWWLIAAATPPDHSKPKTVEEFRARVDDYVHRYRRNAALLELAAFALFLGLLARWQPQWLGPGALAYVLVTTPMAHLLFDRLDVGLLFLLMLWAVTWHLAGGKGRAVARWSAMSWAILGLSISFKLIPVILVPLLWLTEWRIGRRRAVVGAVTMALAIAAPFVVYLPTAGVKVFDFLRYHGERGVQVESLWGSLQILLSWLGVVSVEVVHGHGSYNIDSPIAGALSLASTTLLALLVAVFLVIARRRGSAWSHDVALLAAFYTLGAAVLLAKVLSPQYFVWAVPGLLVLIPGVMSSRRAALTAGALVVLMVMTAWIFPFNYYSQLPGSPPNPHGLVPDVTVVGGTVLIVRNALYVGVIVALGRALWPVLHGRRS